MDNNKIYDSLENEDIQSEINSEIEQGSADVSSDSISVDNIEANNENQIAIENPNTQESSEENIQKESIQKETNTEEIKQVTNDDFDFAEALEVYNILTIDDDKWIQRIFTQYLSTWGFTNISAYDPFSGLTEAIKHKPLMIFLDIHLPEVSGELLIKFLKKIEFTKNIPIIIISGNLNKDIIKSTYLAGASGFITKPFNQETLFAKIKEVLNPAIMNRLIKDGKINTAMIKKKVHLGA